LKENNIKQNYGVHIRGGAVGGSALLGREHLVQQFPLAAGSNTAPWIDHNVGRMAPVRCAEVCRCGKKNKKKLKHLTKEKKKKKKKLNTH
jgi:hypothetical protein